MREAGGGIWVLARTHTFSFFRLLMSYSCEGQTPLSRQNLSMLSYKQYHKALDLNCIYVYMPSGFHPKDTPHYPCVLKAMARGLADESGRAPLRVPSLWSNELSREGWRSSQWNERGSQTQLEIWWSEEVKWDNWVAVFSDPCGEKYLRMQSIPNWQVWYNKTQCDLELAGSMEGVFWSYLQKSMQFPLYWGMWVSKFSFK